MCSLFIQTLLFIEATLLHTKHFSLNKEYWICQAHLLVWFFIQLSCAALCRHLSGHTFGTLPHQELCDQRMEIKSEMNKNKHLLCEVVRSIGLLGNVFIKCGCLASVWVCGCGKVCLVTS